MPTERIIYDISVNIVGGIIGALIISYVFYRHKVKNTIYGLLLDAKSSLGLAEASITSPMQSHYGLTNDLFDDGILIRKGCNYKCYTYNNKFSKINFNFA